MMWWMNDEDEGEDLRVAVGSMFALMLAGMGLFMLVLAFR